MRLEWHGGTGAGDPVMIEIKGELDRRLEQVARAVAAEMRAVAPVGQVTRAAKGGKSWTGRRPGQLRDAIRAVKSRFAGGGWLVIVGDYLTFYWSFVEYGTRKMSARRMFTRAWRRIRPML